MGPNRRTEHRKRPAPGLQATAISFPLFFLLMVRCVLPEVGAESTSDAATRVPPRENGSADVSGFGASSTATPPDPAGARAPSSDDASLNAQTDAAVEVNEAMAATPPSTDSETVDAGSREDAQRTPISSTCATPCGLCSECQSQSGVCTALIGRDDPNGCQIEHTCSASGHCLAIDQAMNSFNARNRLMPIEPSSKYAQLITFGEPGTLEELRALFYCETTNTLPLLSIHEVGDDDTVLENWVSAVGVVVLNEDPTGSDQLQAISLAIPLAVKPGDRVALVVTARSPTDFCWLAVNPTHTYDGGALYLDGVRQAGAMVFQALVVH